MWSKPSPEPAMDTKIKLVAAVGARPNFMKLAPLYSELKKHSQFDTVIVHTGQHYDYLMSKIFFEELGIPEPDYYLGVGSGPHGEQTGRIMTEFEKVLVKERPALVVVFGDVNSTLACSITAKKLFIAVAHVEAGLRSFDMTMPEEINRKLTDSIGDFLFTPSADADENLVREGIGRDKIYLVGNIMIDSLIAVLGKIDKSYQDQILRKSGLNKKNYALITLHRPRNVDYKDSLTKILDFLNELSEKITVIFPMHPRTRKNMDSFGIKADLNSRLKIVEPMKYGEFIALEKNAGFVITDSGGIQEETTYLNIPCLTLRPNTERPVTITEGTNRLITMESARQQTEQILSGKWKSGRPPELWDGRTAERMAGILKNEFVR
jgi:UDP-N-acetylglucosamine 2-epimerase (non-hydrolysing)